MQIVDAIFGTGRVPEGPVARAARSGAEAEFTAVFDASTGDAAAAPDAGLPGLAAVPLAPSIAESDIRFIDARPLTVVSEATIEPAFEASGAARAADLPMDPADPEIPVVPLVPVIAPLGGPPESRVPEVEVVVAAPAVAAPARAAGDAGDAAGTVTDLERVVVPEAFPVPGAPVPVGIEAAPVSGRAQAVPENDLPARPESYAGEPAVPEQTLTSARDLSQPPLPAGAAGMRPDSPKGRAWAPYSGDPAALLVRVPGAGLAPEGVRPMVADLGASAMATKDAEHSAPSLGDAIPAVGSRVAPSAPTTVAPAATPQVADTSTPVEPAEPQTVVTPAVHLRLAPADAAMSELRSSPVPEPVLNVLRPEAPVARPDGPVRILSDARRPSAPEPAAVAAPVASPAVTERSLAPAEVAAPAPAMDRAVAPAMDRAAVHEMREPARSDPGVVAATMTTRPMENANVALQVPDVAVQVDVPELSTPRSTEAPGGPSSSMPVAASDVDVRRAVVDQLLATVRATSAGTVEIMLSPEELGQVRLDMKMVDGVMTVRIDAERPETLDLMRRGADVLFRELRDAGFGALNLSFGSGTPQRGSFASSGDAAGRPDRDTHLDVQAATAPSGAARGVGPARLDIRI